MRLEIELLIKQILDGIAGVAWSPGAFSQTPARPFGTWAVSAGSGLSTSTRRMATLETTVRVSIWTDDPAARARLKSEVAQAFSNVGFTVLAPNDAEETGGTEQTLYTSAMTFRAWIDTATGWVYQNQNA